MDLLTLALALKKAKEYTDDKKITSEDGAFGLRLYEGALQYYDGEKWVTISISSQPI